MGATRNTGYLENIILYDSSDNVGIAGAVNASYKVTLGGSLSGTAAVFSSSVTSTAFVPTGSAIPTNGMYLSAANTLNFATNSGSRLSISSTGAATFSSSISATSATFSGIVEVGNTVGSAINSASGLGNLVVGNGGASSQGITIYTGASTYGGLNFADATTGGGAYAGYIKFDHSDNSMGFFIGNVSRLSIASTGAATFSSSVTANGISSIGQEQAFTFQRTTGTASDVYSFNADSGSAYLYNNTTAKPLMVWAEGGNVGIGTPSPDVTGFGYTTLTIKGGTTAGYAGVLELQTTQTTTNGQNVGIIAFLDGTSRNAQIGVQRDTSTSTSNMMFYTNGGSGIVERMRITSGGAINIGTTSAIGGLRFQRGSSTGLIGYMVSDIPGFTDIAGISLYAENVSGGSQAGYIVLATSTAATSYERVRITSDGYLRLASKGIQFNGDTADANSLDDYEEGTWTPVIGGTGGESGQSYSGQAGYYTKIGNQVTVTFRVVLNTKGTITGNAAIKGLPFTAANTISFGSGATYFEALGASWNSIFFMVTGGNTYASIDGTRTSATATVRATTSDITNTSQFNGSFTYFV